jgi:glutamine synthetase
LTEQIKNRHQSEAVVSFVQQYRMYDLNGTKPSESSVCRELAEAHFIACTYAGIEMTSFENFNSNLHDWTYEITATNNDLVNSCDSVWMARFILHRLAEDFNITTKFESALNDRHSQFSVSKADKDLFSKLSVSFSPYFESFHTNPADNSVKFTLNEANFDPYSIASSIFS